jgi:hypothetical protein
MKSFLCLFLALTICHQSVASGRDPAFAPYISFFEYQLKKLERLDLKEYLALKVSTIDKEKRAEIESQIKDKDFKLLTTSNGNSITIDLILDNNKIISFVANPSLGSFVVQDHVIKWTKEYNLEDEKLAQTVKQDYHNATKRKEQSKVVKNFSIFDLLISDAQADPTLILLAASVGAALLTLLAVDFVSLFIQGTVLSIKLITRFFNEYKLGGDFCCNVANNYIKRKVSYDDQLDVGCEKRANRMLQNISSPDLAKNHSTTESIRFHESIIKDVLKDEPGIVTSWWTNNVVPAFSENLPKDLDLKLLKHTSDVLKTCEQEKSSLVTDYSMFSVFMGGWVNSEAITKITNNPECVKKFNRQGKQINSYISTLSRDIEEYKSCNKDLDNIHTNFVAQSKKTINDRHINSDERSNQKYQQIFDSYEKQIKSISNKKGAAPQ